MDARIHKTKQKIRIKWETDKETIGFAQSLPHPPRCQKWSWKTPKKHSILVVKDLENRLWGRSNPRYRGRDDRLYPRATLCGLSRFPRA